MILAGDWSGDTKSDIAFVGGVPVRRPVTAVTNAAGGVPPPTPHPPPPQFSQTPTPTISKHRQASH